MHKLMNILEVKEIDFDANVVYCNVLCINFRCSENKYSSSSLKISNYHV
jgi:hypothetical protein